MTISFFSIIISFIFVQSAVKSPYSLDENEDGNEEGSLVGIDLDSFAEGFLSLGDLMQLNKPFLNGPMDEIPPMGPMIMATVDSEFEQPIVEEHYTITDGTNTIEVTEIHVVGNRRNLNKRSGSPLPMMLFRNIDEVFDNLFNEIASSVISEGIGHNETAEYEENDEFNITEIAEEDLKLENEEEKEVLLELEKEIKEPKKEERVLESKEEKTINNLTETQIVESSVAKGPNVKDMIMNSKQKKKQIKDMKKKEAFAKICKYVFYSLFFFGLYVIIKKLLLLLGLIEEARDKPENVNEAIEMKANSVKNE